MFANYVRDSNVVKNNFKKLNNKWIAIKPCKVIFPVHYAEKKLCEFNSEITKVLGIVMILVNNTYAVLSVNAMIEFTPGEISTIELEGEQYYQMSFDAGSTVINNMKVVKEDILPYFIYDVFISKGRIPGYMNYEDVCKIFDTAKSYADANVGERPEVIQLMVSIVARDKNDRTKYYRQVVKDHTDNSRLVFIPMKSVEYGATNTVNKLGGNYFQTGVISALINPSDKVENIESILRE